MTAAIEHPGWCVLSLCDAATGGAHRSKARLIPDEPAARHGLPLAADLVQAVDGPPLVRLGDNGSIIELPLRMANRLGWILRDLAAIARRAER